MVPTLPEWFRQLTSLRGEGRAPVQPPVSFQTIACGVRHRSNSRRVLHSLSSPPAQDFHPHALTIIYLRLFIYFRPHRLPAYARSQGRSLYFTPRETLIFGYLFDLADTDDDGLVGANDGGHALLGRARLPPSTLQRLWAEAGGERCVLSRWGRVSALLFDCSLVAGVLEGRCAPRHAVWVLCLSSLFSGCPMYAHCTLLYVAAEFFLVL